MKEIREINDDCPSNDYEIGVPQGQCWGDGHYLCDNCKHFRNDFFKDKEFREFMHRPPIMTIKQINHKDKIIRISEIRE